MSEFHPELRFARFIPRVAFRPALVSVMRRLARIELPLGRPRGVTLEKRVVPGPAGAPDVRLRVFRPDAMASGAPAMLWIHGGGFVMGSPVQDDGAAAWYARTLGILVASVHYRLAPEHPHPAAVEDAYAALRWLHDEAPSLRIDRARIVIGGASAGGGLAAGLALLARDRGVVRPAFQLLIYPMLDDRTTTRADVDERNLRLWNPASNRYGWRAYLGFDGGRAEGVPVYAAPARATDLRGLPPAWLGVGTLDLFHDEDVAYARRLAEQGVRADLEVVAGAFHGFDAIARRTEVVRAFRASQLASIRRALALRG